MNRLNRIQALNLKGQPIDAPLTPLTAIIGPNAGGKTAVAHAVTIALLGFVPALGKKPQATVQLMTPGAPMIDIQAILETGERINRRFDVKKGVKTTTTGPDFSDLVNPCQLDFDQFIAAKPTDRQRILESLLVATAEADVIEDARTRIAKTGQELATALDGDGWLQALETEAKDQARLLKQDLDTAAKTILQLSGEETPSGFDAAALAQTEASLASAREKLGQARQTFDGLAEAQQEAPDQPDGEEVTEAMLADTQVKLDAVSKAIQDHKDATARRKAAEERAAEIMRPHSGIEAVEAVAAPMTAEELIATKRSIDNQRQELATATSRARTNVDHAKRALEEAEKRRDSLDGMECCPTCGVAGKTFRESVAEITAEDIKAKAATLAEAQETLTKLEGGVDALVEAEEAYKAKVTEREQHAAYQARLRADEALAGTDVQPFDLGAALDRKVQLDDLLSRGRRDARAWIEWRAAKVPTAEEVQKAETAFQDALRVVASLEETEKAQKSAQEAVTAWRGNQARMAELERENEKRTSEIAALKELGDWAKAKSLELTAAAMRPLLDVCNRVLDGLVVGEIGIDGTAVGIHRGEAFHPLEVLSGSEAAAVAAALQIAIAGKSEFRLVMIDELSRFSAERKTRFLTNLATAITDGLIDQVLVFDHDPETGYCAERLQGGSKLKVAEA